jgi:hypothetical protein
MTKKDLAELLKYSSPKELWVITWNDILKRIFCPFKVRVLQDVGLLKRGQIVLVSEVKVTLELKTVYVIDKEAYYYYHFEILVE